MGAILLTRSQIGVRPPSKRRNSCDRGRMFGDNKVIAGCPAKVVRDLLREQAEALDKLAASNVVNALYYTKAFAEHLLGKTTGPKPCPGPIHDQSAHFMRTVHALLRYCEQSPK